jgi:hypothetical protein
MIPVCMEFMHVLLQRPVGTMQSVNAQKSVPWCWVWLCFCQASVCICNVPRQFPRACFWNRLLCCTTSSFYEESEITSHSIYTSREHRPHCPAFFLSSLPTICLVRKDTNERNRMVPQVLPQTLPHSINLQATRINIPNHTQLHNHR